MRKPLKRTGERSDGHTYSTLYHTKPVTRARSDGHTYSTLHHTKPVTRARLGKRSFIFGQ